MLDAIQNVLNFLFAPQYLSAIAIGGLALFLRYRVICTQNPWISGAILATPILFFGVSALEEHFWIQFRRADNLPIAGLMFAVVFFVWYATRKAVINDQRMAAGEGPWEADPEEEEKVFVWPDLVYTEMLCLLLVSILLVAWSVLIPAPLEEPANPSLTPNPSKAPWYFLGLQEILVYYDPWIAGVVIPTLIIVGLVTIPYIDPNPKGNGYYTYVERRWEIMTFLFGFLILWVFLVFQGTFLRGPNFDFFGPYEYWDIHKLVPLLNVQLSDYFYARLLQRAVPQFWLWREICGILLVLGYLVVLPIWLAKTWFKRFYVKMGPVRYGIAVFLFLMMLSVPIKMYLRWTVNLKYFVYIPEFFFNI